ncbi:MAG TPA: TonB family protein [Gemmatimonadales bacterium]|nr:TonB family protein [Gemmatimonadales bacterium]
MYDDLARSQRPSPLEWLVVNVLLPSVLVTFAWQARADLPAERSNTATWDPVVCVLPVLGLDEWHYGPIPDVFPILVTIPRPTLPSGVGGLGPHVRVFLKALVTPAGRVSDSSIVIVQSPDGELDAAARGALARAVFRPARLGGRPIAASITIAVEFKPRRG